VKRAVGEHARIKGFLGANGQEFQPAPHTATQAPVLAASQMTSAARLSELGGLLALGFRRLLVSSQNQLAEWGDAERSCDSVDRPENPNREDVA